MMMQFFAKILINYVRARQRKGKRISIRTVLHFSAYVKGTLTELIGSLSSTLVPTYSAFLILNSFFGIFLAGPALTL